MLRQITGQEQLGHRCIAGDEEADKGAKRAAKQVPIVEPLSFADMDRYLKDTVWRLQQDDWDISTTQLRALKTDVRTTEDGSKTTHQEGESRPQQTYTGTYATDDSYILTSKQQPLLWIFNFV